MIKRLVIRSKIYGPEVNWDTNVPEDQVESHISSHQHLYGLPERWKWQDECTSEELSEALESRDVEVFPASPGDPEAMPPIEPTQSVVRTEVRLPQTYTIEITDITQQENQKLLGDYMAQKIAEADAQVTVLVGGITDRRATATALFNLGVVVNPLGNFSQSQIDAAKSAVGSYFSIMAQIEQLFAQRDADIESYKTSLGL